MYYSVVKNTRCDVCVAAHALQLRHGSLQAMERRVAVGPAEVRPLTGHPAHTRKRVEAGHGRVGPNAERRGRVR